MRKSKPNSIEREMDAKTGKLSQTSIDRKIAQIGLMVKKLAWLHISCGLPAPANGISAPTKREQKRILCADVASCFADGWQFNWDFQLDRQIVKLLRVEYPVECLISSETPLIRTAAADPMTAIVHHLIAFKYFSPCGGDGNLFALDQLSLRLDAAVCDQLRAHPQNLAEIREGLKGHYVAKLLEDGGRRYSARRPA